MAAADTRGWGPSASRSAQPTGPVQWLRRSAKSWEPDPGLLIMASSPFALDLTPPYYAVIFPSMRTPGDQGYEETSKLMVDLARTMPGYLGIESARSVDGFGITVSYWRNEASI